MLCYTHKWIYCERIPTLFHQNRSSPRLLWIGCIKYKVKCRKMNVEFSARKNTLLEAASKKEVLNFHVEMSMEDHFSSSQQLYKKDLGGVGKPTTMERGHVYYNTHWPCKEDNKLIRQMLYFMEVSEEMSNKWYLWGQKEVEANYLVLFIIQPTAWQAHYAKETWVFKYFARENAKSTKRRKASVHFVVPATNVEGICVHNWKSFSWKYEYIWSAFV